MKRFFVPAVLAVFMCMMGCLAPDSRSSSRAVTAALSAVSGANIAGKDVNGEDSQVVAGNKEEQNKEPEPSPVVQSPMTPANLASSLYFGIRVLTENEGNDEDADRRLTIKFNAQGTKADFGDADTEAESKEAKTKQNLDVHIEGMFVTLLDNGREFLKLEVSKDFQFMFITEDKFSKPKPYQILNYQGTGFVLNGREVPPSNILGSNKSLVTPPLPEYPFES